MILMTDSEVLILGEMKDSDGTLSCNWNGGVISGEEFEIRRDALLGQMTHRINDEDIVSYSFEELCGVLDEQIGEDTDSESLNVEVEETGETDDSDDGDMLQLKLCAIYQDIIDNAYEFILASNMAQVKESELTFFGESNENLSEQTVQVAYFDFLSGDVSLLENIEFGQHWVDFILPISELEYVFLDLDGDDISELLIQEIDSPESYNAVFHYHDGKLLCWNSDEVETTCRDYPFQNGTMVRQYDYGGSSNWTVFRYLPDGKTEELFELFAHYEAMYYDDPSDVPHYEIDGVEVDQMTFESELEERITNQMLERSMWTAIVEKR